MVSINGQKDQCVVPKEIHYIQYYFSPPVYFPLKRTLLRGCTKTKSHYFGPPQIPPPYLIVFSHKRIIKHNNQRGDILFWYCAIKNDKKHLSNFWPKVNIEMIYRSFSEPPTRKNWILCEEIGFKRNFLSQILVLQ